MKGLLDDGTLMQIGAVLGQNKMVSNHVAAEDLDAERPTLRITIRVYGTFVDYPADLVNLMRKVRSILPRQYIIDWKIRTTT